MVAILQIVGSFLVLTFLELVLAVDNALILLLMAQGLPAEQRMFGQRVAIILGAAQRVVLIMVIGWISKLLVPIPVVSELLHGLTGHEFTIKSGINVCGGFILVAMAAHHIHGEWRPGGAHRAVERVGLLPFLVKTFGVSFIFSIDSVMSAVGTVDHLWVAGLAIFVAALVMVFSVNVVSDILSRYPDVKSLGLSFVLYVGGILIAEGFGNHFPKIFIYLPLGFALFVQLIDIMRDRAQAQVEGEKLMGQTSTREVSGDGV